MTIPPEVTLSLVLNSNCDDELLEKLQSYLLKQNPSFLSGLNNCIVERRSNINKLKLGRLFAFIENVDKETDKGASIKKDYLQRIKMVICSKFLELYILRLFNMYISLEKYEKAENIIQFITLPSSPVQKKQIQKDIWKAHKECFTSHLNKTDILLAHVMRVLNFNENRAMCRFTSDEAFREIVRQLTYSTPSQDRVKQAEVLMNYIDDSKTVKVCQRNINEARKKLSPSCTIM